MSVSKRWIPLMLAAALAAIGLGSCSGPAFLNAVYGTKIPVASVTVSPISATLAIGSTLTLKAAILPSDASEQNVAWASSDATVATVDTGGKVMGIAAGSATITATSSDGKRSAKATLSVAAPTIATKAVLLDKQSATLVIGYTIPIVATVMPYSTADKTVTWASSNTAVATVSAAGLVSALAVGTATVTATSRANAATATCPVTVLATSPISVQSVAISGTSSISVGGTSQLTATVVPASAAATNPTTWSSSDPTIVTVSSSGLVTGVKNGQAVIFASAGGVTANCILYVSVIHVGNVSLNVSSITVDTKYPSQLVATIYPSTASDPSLTWSSSDITIASVDASGNVTGKAPGSVTVTATTTDGGQTATCAVTVVAYVAVTGLTISNSGPLSISSGSYGYISYTVGPSNATNKSIAWTSDTPAVAKQSTSYNSYYGYFYVDGIHDGHARMTGVTVDGNFTAGIEVSVMKPANLARTVTSGTGSASFTAVYAGTTGGSALVYAAGNMQSTGGTLNFGGTASVAGSGSTYSSATDALLVQYDSVGNAQWAKNVTCTNGTTGWSSIAVDQTGAAYLSCLAYSSAAATFNFGNSVTKTLSGTSGGVIAKYDSSGNAQWAKALTGWVTYSIAVDGSGNNYTLGNVYSAGTYDFGNSKTIVLASNSNYYFLLKCDSSGTAQWIKQLPAQFVAAATDSSGNILIATQAISTGSYTIDAKTATLASAGVLIAQLGTGGTANWLTNSTTASGSTTIVDIASDPSGNVLVAGTTSGTFSIGASYTYSNPYSVSGFVAKLDSSGNAQWIKGVTNATISAYFTGLATDSSGNVYAGGYMGSYGTIGFDTSKVTVTGGLSYNNPFIVKFDTSGRALWAEAWNNGPSSCNGYNNSVAVDASNDVYTVGYATKIGNFDFGNSVALNSLNATSNPLLVKYH